MTGQRDHSEVAEPQIAEHSCLSVQPRRLHERSGTLIVSHLRPCSGTVPLEERPVSSERPRNSTPKKPPARIYTWGADVTPAPLRGGGQTPIVNEESWRYWPTNRTVCGRA